MSLRMSFAQRPQLGCAEFEGVLVMAALRCCSVVQAISAPKGRGSPSPGQRPGEPCRDTNAIGPTGQRFSLQSQPQATQILYRRKRLARWAEKCSALAYDDPGRCPGLGEPRAFGPAAYCVSPKRTGVLPTRSDPRSWVSFAHSKPPKPQALNQDGALATLRCNSPKVMSRLLTLAVLGWCILPIGPSRAAEKSALQAMLERPIVGPTVPMMEIERYCEARVKRMPVVSLIAQWEVEAERRRAAILEQVVFRGEATRWRDAPSKTQWLQTMPGGKGYRIQKLRFEALPGMWIPALLYLPDNLTGKVPVVLNVNGHVGKPGKSVDYKQIRCINQAKRGMLALNVEWLGMGQLSDPEFHHGRMNQLDLCGTSGLAPFYLSLKRSIDLLLSLPNADPSRVAVTGLSGGGWQTIFVSALDRRVTLANPVAGYSSFLTRIHHVEDLGDSEQTPSDLVQ